MSTTLRLPLTGLSCASCVRRAETAVAGLQGVEDVSVNLANHTATVQLTDKGETTAVLDALKSAGYPARTQSLRLKVDGMSCASCVGRVETALKAVDGVVSVAANLATQTATLEVVADGPNAALLADVSTKAGYAAHPLDTDHVDKGPREDETLARMAAISGVLTLPVVVLAMGGHIVPAFHHWIGANIGHFTNGMIQFALTTLVLIWPGAQFFRKGVPALMRRAPDMNALVVLGTGAAWLYSTTALFAPSLFPAGSAVVYFEAAAVITTLILLGRWLEARAKGRAGAAINRLIALQPDIARVVTPDGIVERPVAQVTPGDTLQLKPGDRVPVDGVVASGASWIDESMLTGEPAPVEKTQGASVSSGTVNGNGTLTFTATNVGADTALARIIRMVEDAQAAKLPVQKLMDRVTAVFVPIVMAVAVVTVLLWLVFGPDPALGFALVAGVSVLIIACPCAMGLATPTSIMVGIGRAAESGVLFRRGDALQSLRDATWVLFDKTGTLTEGRPSVTEVSDGATEETLQLLSTLEAQSEHPLADAILRHMAPLEGASVEDFKATPGKGISGRVAGHSVLAGTARFLQEQGVKADALVTVGEDYAQAGKTPVYAAIDGQAACVLGISDPIKPEAKAAIAELKALGVRTAMVTGDLGQTAQAVGDALQIDAVHAELLPEDKHQVVTRYKEAHQGGVVFVGDGINDAPALARADVGIAIGTGTDVAIEAADVVLMSGDVTGALRAIQISRATLRNIRQNLFWAFAYNAALIPVAAGLLYPIWGMMLSPMLASAAMGLSSVFVVTNALRLRWTTLA